MVADWLVAAAALAGTTIWLFEKVQPFGAETMLHVHCGCPHMDGTSRLTLALHPEAGEAEGIDAALPTVTICVRIKSLILALTCAGVELAVNPLEARELLKAVRQELMPLLPQ